MKYCAEHKDQRKDAFLAAITTDCPYCRIAELEQQLSRYQGAVEVEGCWVTDRGNIHVPSCNQSLDHIEANTKVRVLVYPQAEKGAVALKEVE